MISVIIPVYNGERFILQAVDCVRKQTYADWELIIVDDGSTDGTAQLLDTLTDDRRIHVIHQPNGGVSAARNTGIDAAKGTHVALLDADDLWHKSHLEVLADLIERYPQAGLLATYAEVQLVTGERKRECAFFEGKPEVLYTMDFFEEYARDKRAKMYNACSTCFLKEAVQQAGGFRKGCRIGEDLGLSLWVSAYYPVVLTSKVTAVYMKVNSVATKDVSFDPDWYFFEDVQKILADETIPAEKRQNIRSVMDWFEMRRSRHYMIEGRRKEARAAYRRISNNKELGKDRWITAALLWMPQSLVRRIFSFRWRSQS